MRHLVEVAREYRQMGLSVIPVNASTPLEMIYLDSEQSSEDFSSLAWDNATGIAIVSASLQSDWFSSNPYLVYTLMPLPNIAPVTLEEKFEFLGEAIVEECLDHLQKGDAELFAYLYKDRVVYDHTERAWYFWNGQVWCKDGHRLILRLLSNQLSSQYHLLTLSYYEKSTNEETANYYKQKVKVAKKRQKALFLNGYLRAVEQLAMSELAFCDNWDDQPGRWSVKNGMVNLKTGQRSIRMPNQYLRHTSPISWQGLDCPAPRFEKFLDEIFDGDKDLIEFLQRLLGYSMLGQPVEHCLPIFVGNGRNGKDTLLETLAYVLGNLAGSVNQDVIIGVDSVYSAGAAKPHLMTLIGKRLVWVSETGSEAPLNAARVKMLTGGGQITARALHQNEITFSPTHVLILSTNFLPQIKGSDYALWERILVIRFPFSFVDAPSNPNERLRDRQLREKLKAEASGIAAWLVRGCLMYQKDGLHQPDSVRQNTRAYEEESDVVRRFLNERMEYGNDYKIQANALHKEYEQWATENNMQMLGQRNLSQRIEQLGYPKQRKGQGILYYGFRSLNSTAV